MTLAYRLLRKVEVKGNTQIEDEEEEKEAMEKKWNVTSGHKCVITLVHY